MIGKQVIFINKNGYDTKIHTVTGFHDFGDIGTYVSFNNDEKNMYNIDNIHIIDDIVSDDKLYTDLYT